MSLIHNPYKEGTEDSTEWAAGYHAAQNRDWREQNPEAGYDDDDDDDSALGFDVVGNYY